MNLIEFITNLLSQIFGKKKVYAQETNSSADLAISKDDQRVKALNDGHGLIERYELDGMASDGRATYKVYYSDGVVGSMSFDGGTPDNEINNGVVMTRKIKDCINEEDSLSKGYVYYPVGSSKDLRLISPIDVCNLQQAGTYRPESASRVSHYDSQTHFAADVARGIIKVA